MKITSLQATKYVFILASFLLTQISTSFAQIKPQEFFRFSKSLNAEYQTYERESVFSSDPLSIARIGSLVDSATTYEEFLARLHILAPEIFLDPVLIHSSASLQPASLTSPRVILYRRGVAVALSEPSSAVERRVEILELNPNTKAVQLGEIRFVQSGPPTVELNPPKCFACHGTPARAIWAPYDIWPGAFHSQASVLSSSEEYQAVRDYRQKTEARGVKKYLRFTRQAPASLETGSSPANETFTQYIFNINSVRLGDFFKRKKSEIKNYRYALAGALNGCTVPQSDGRQGGVEFSTFFGAGFNERYKKEIAFYEADTLASRRDLVRTSTARYAEIFVSSNASFSLTTRLEFEAYHLAHVRFLLERLGLAWRELTTGFGENDYSMQVPGHILGELTSIYAESDPDLFHEMRPPLVDLGGIQYAFFDCAQLAERSRVALDRVESLPSVDQLSRDHASAGLTPYGRCVKCHATSTRELETPMIPFHDNSRLKVWLNTDDNFALVKDKVESGKMPLESRLTSKERHALIEVFQEIREL